MKPDASACPSPGADSTAPRRSAHQRMVLAAIEAAALTTQALAERAGLTLADTVRTLGELERRRLVRLSPTNTWEAR